MNDLEEEYFGSLRRHHRQEKKRAQKLDRSRFKKTDREKAAQKIKENVENSLRGRVLTIFTQGIVVECEGKNYLSTIRGTLKQNRSQQKNLIVVGDYVRILPQNDEEAVIVDIEPRTSLLSRADNLNQRKEHIIAANIDQVFITISVGSPKLRPAIIDRYILAARKGGLKPIVVVNKMDLLTKEEAPILEDLKKALALAHITCIGTSTRDETSIQNLKNLIKDHSSVFSGPSGVGKSSLISAITGQSLRTQGVVEKTKKGSHTTTKTSIIPLPWGGYTVDTPGIKSFGMWNFTKKEIRDGFPDFHAFSPNCLFSDCYHLDEKGCAVKEALENSVLPFFRYESYINLLRSATEEHLRR